MWAVAIHKFNQWNSKSLLVLLLILYTHTTPPQIMWTLAKQVKLHSFCKKPSYILLYIVVCKICSICCFSSRYNFIAKSYPMLDLLLMQLPVLEMMIKDIAEWGKQQGWCVSLTAHTCHSGCTVETCIFKKSSVIASYKECILQYAWINMNCI